MTFLQSLFTSAAPRDAISLALAAAPLADRAGPWRPIVTHAVGGLTAVGFDRTAEVMLVTSATGQSVIDGATGEILYRNRQDDGLDVAALKGTRLDSPADERFDMAGLYGGGLRRVTDDGWSVAHMAGHALLHPKDASIQFLAPEWDSYRKDSTFHLLDRSGEDMRAFGFSWTGRTLALATPSTLVLWGRPEPLTL